jgi:hypothetical protein
VADLRFLSKLPHTPGFQERVSRQLIISKWESEQPNLPRVRGYRPLVTGSLADEDLPRWKHNEDEQSGRFGIYEGKN